MIPKVLKKLAAIPRVSKKLAAIPRVLKKLAAIPRVSKIPAPIPKVSKMPEDSEGLEDPAMIVALLLTLPQPRHDPNIL